MTDGSLQISSGTPSRGIFSYGDECRYLSGGLHYEIESTISRTGGKMMVCGAWRRGCRERGAVCCLRTPCRMLLEESMLVSLANMDAERASLTSPVFLPPPPPPLSTLQPGWDPEARGPSIVCDGSTMHTTMPSALDNAEWARGAGHVAPGTVAKWELEFSSTKPFSSADIPIVFAAGVVAEAAHAVDFRTSRGYSLAMAPWFFGARDKAGPLFDIKTAANCKLNEDCRWEGNVFTFTLDRTGPSGTLSWSHFDNSGKFTKFKSYTVSGIPATGMVFPAACIPTLAAAHPRVKITALEGLIDGSAVQQVELCPRCGPSPQGSSSCFSLSSYDRGFCSR